MVPKGQFNYLMHRLEPEGAFLERMAKIEEEKERQRQYQKLMELRRKAYSYQDD